GVRVGVCGAEREMAGVGRGPRKEDVTPGAVAKAADVELVFSQESYDKIAAMFRRRNRVMPDRNRVQAQFPAGAEPVPNHHGTAPGIWMKLGDAHVAAMPGVPSEMYAMFEHQILPKVLALGLSGGVLVRRKINTFGMGESGVEERLLDLTKRGHVPEVGITVHDAVISLRILAHAPTRAEAQALIGPVERTIRERLGELVFGVEDEGLHDAVAALLAAKRKTLATAESITCGLVAHSLAHVPGVSAWLRGGIIAYTNEVKTALLGVPKALLDEKTAVSPEVAQAMAVGVRSRMGT